MSSYRAKNYALDLLYHYTAFSVTFYYAFSNKHEKKITFFSRFSPRGRLGPGGVIPGENQGFFLLSSRNCRKLAPIAPKTPPIERYDFSASTYFFSTPKKIFFFSIKKNKFFFFENP